MNKREREDQRRRRFEGYYEGASGRSSQFEWDDESLASGRSAQTFGDDAKWKNSRRAEHYNNDHFGYGSRDRAWDKHLDNRREDERNHFGKGPKGYQRSNQRIREDACEALTRSPHIDATEIELNVEDGIVTLTGTVESRRIKKEAERVVETVLGVEDVVNLLKMVGEPRADRGEGQTNYSI